jgi:L-alanine-DL-glutamate epimerase-like enolase superfamily enzyme
MGDSIEKVEAFCLRVPYRGHVQFASAEDTHSPYALLRITTKDGAQGIAEAIARPQQFQGEDIQTIAHQIETFFRPMLIGKNPLHHDEILAALRRIKQCRAAKQMIDVALWDLKGKLLGQPVWRLLGGDDPEPVPISTIVFGNTVKEMIKDATEAVKKQGVRGFKIKTWKRSMDDVAVVRDIRKALGDDVILYADANSVYNESEARRVFPHFAEYDIKFIEDPCQVTTIDRLANLAKDLPLPILGDNRCESLESVYSMIKIDAIGGVSVKLRRNGITEALKIIHLCQAAGLPVVIGTDAESRIGAMARVHLWAAFRYLHAMPAETGFFRHLADDVFDGPFTFAKGAITVPDTPGFGAAIDEKKLKKYLI